MPNYRPPYPEEMRARAVELYRGGKSVRAVGTELGVSVATVTLWCRAAGLRMRRKADYFKPFICRRCGVALTEENWPHCLRQRRARRCRKCNNALSLRWQRAHPERKKRVYSDWACRVKLEVLAHYGMNGTPKCIQCGYSDIRALCIDHINDDGYRLRKFSKGQDRAVRSGNTYIKLRHQGFPPGHQTLCFNCNAIKEMERRRRLGGSKRGEGQSLVGP